ncbi:MAG: NAD(P)H-quinone oxidoreductase [Chloroflexota bacterium]|nr:NAD(P)H-quinone oxidoreductase [Dehalococcoidia bacterium]MDW8253208.1 NAD(P)H-quinone oxidoreductase [Chloroflexota bacterium]
MKAVVIEQYGGPEVMRWGDADRPSLGAGEILVRVRAAGVNQADLTARANRYPERTPVPGIYFYPFRSLPAIPGIEIAGEVVELGPGVTRWNIGDRVCGIAGSGGYAEYARMLDWVAMPIPAGLDFVAGAAIPVAFLTSWLALSELINLRRGETLLVHAVGAGVGQALVQLGKLIGARVIGTEIVAEKIARAKALGLDAGCNSREEDFVAWALRETEGRGVDAVVDTLGGPVFAASLRALALNGRIVPLSTTLGATPEIELGQLIGKHLAVFGMSTAAMLTPDRVRRFQREVLSAFPALLTPVVDRTFPMAEAAEAHRYLAAGAHFGKVVLTLP